MVDTSKNMLTLEVVTHFPLAPDLIAANDELLKKYPGDYQSIFIFYFDDKKYADNFFNIYGKPNPTDQETKELSHNIAMYYHDKDPNGKYCLTKRANVGWNILKCY